MRMLGSSNYPSKIRDQGVPRPKQGATNRGQILPRAVMAVTAREPTSLLTVTDETCMP